MQPVIIGKARPVGNQEVPSVLISITSELPEFSGGLKILGIQFEQDAERLELALIGSLPGGTYDRLLGRMLARKASHFRIPHVIVEAS